MPLSEQEQRLLEEMERSLYQNDADFVPTTGARRGRPNYTVLVVGALIGLLGIATLIVGVISQLAWLASSVSRSCSWGCSSRSRHPAA